MREMFETRTHAWREAGLERELSPSRVNRARRDAVILLVAIVGVLILNDQRRDLFPGFTKEFRFLTVVVLVILGWAFARAIGPGPRA